MMSLWPDEMRKEVHGAQVKAWQSEVPLAICVSSSMRHTSDTFCSQDFMEEIVGLLQREGIRALAVLSRWGISERLYLPIGLWVA